MLYSIRGLITKRLKSGLKNKFGGIIRKGPSGNSKELWAYGFACIVLNTTSKFHGYIPVCLKADLTVSGLNVYFRMCSKTVKNSVIKNVITPILTALSIT
jgi:hypothetical protein